MHMQFDCLFHNFRLTILSCMPPPVSSAVILTKAVGGNEVIIWEDIQTQNDILINTIFYMHNKEI